MQKKNFTDHITNVLLVLAAICIVALLIKNVFFGNKETSKPAETYFKEYNYTKDTIPFEIDSVLSMYEEDSLNYIIQYAYNDTIYDLYTTPLEADYLKVYQGCMELYKDMNSYEDIDDLNSYLLNNSHTEYIDNEYYTGFIWIYDACPMYRFPIP